MGKLRDWWPSEEMLERSRSSNSAATSSAHTASTAVAGNVSSETVHISGTSRSPFSHAQNMDALASPSDQLSTVPSCSAAAAAAAATLRLSEVAAALNAMPTGHPSSVPSTPSEPTSAASSSSPLPQLSLSRPVIKLTNTQDHKDELLKKLLSRSESSSDLQIGLQHKTRSAITALPASPQSQAPYSQAQRNMSSAVCLDRRDSYNQAPIALKEISSKPQLRIDEDSSDLRKRKRNTFLSLRSTTIASKAVQEQKLPAVASDLPGIPKDSLTRREIHIFSERQRRKGMTHLYAILHSLLPDAKPKTDRCTVLTEAMDYIHELQVRLDELGRQKSDIIAKLEEQLNMDSSAEGGGLLISGGADGAETSMRMQHMAMEDLLTEEMREEILEAADVVVRFCGRDAFITLNSPRRNGVWSGILQVLHQQDMELLNVTLSTSNDMIYHCIHAKVSNTDLDSQELQKMLQEVVLNHAILD